MVTCDGQPVHVVDEVDVDEHHHGDPLPGGDAALRGRRAPELHLEAALRLVVLPHERGRAVVGGQPHHALAAPLLQALGRHGRAATRPPLQSIDPLLHCVYCTAPLLVSAPEYSVK